MQSMQLTSSFCGSQAAFQARPQRGCAGRAARPVLIKAQSEPEAQVMASYLFELLHKSFQLSLVEITGLSGCVSDVRARAAINLACPVARLMASGYALC